MWPTLNSPIVPVIGRRYVGDKNGCRLRLADEKMIDSYNAPTFLRYQYRYAAAICRVIIEFNVCGQDRLVFAFAIALSASVVHEI